MTGGVEIVIVLMPLVVVFGLGFLIERVRQGAAYRTHGEILKQAEVEAANLRKSQELAAKEELLKHRESMERELQKTRDELRELERKLDRREIVLNEQQEDMGKKDRMLELTQHKLTDRSKALEVREREVERILQEEQEQLFKISGLDKKAATEILLERLDRQLKNETGALHPQISERTQGRLRPPGSRSPFNGGAALRGGRTPRRRRSLPSTFRTTR